jgi:choline dehydrogenase
MTDFDDSRFHDSADYVVVGAGSAGAVLANRLSADAGVRVVLLEAGGRDTSRAIRIPAMFSQLFKSEFDWDYETEPQPELGGRRIYWPRGKVLGGSSSINAMMWVRGFAADYDGWATVAGSDWSFESLRPYFERVAVSVESQRSPRDHTGTFLRAAVEAGFDLVDPETPSPDGFSQTMLSQRNGARASTADAYLRPVRTRAELDIRTGAHATRVLFDGTRAIGVEYLVDGRRRTVGARREVILSGGSINTPQLLMLSGIGDAARLKALGIDVVAHSPEVGQNLRDHLVSLLTVSTDGGSLSSATDWGQRADYLLRRRGMLTSNMAEAYGFVRSDPSLALPDLEILFTPVAYLGEGLGGIPGHGLSVGPILLQPKSRGEISLASADPLAKPLIDPRYLSDAAGQDRAVLMAGLAISERILQTAAMRAGWNGRFMGPEGGESLEPIERDALSLTSLSHTLYHPTGTVRMGMDAAAPVDPELRMRGVTGLRVADASVMPEIIRGHTNAPAIVIGEKAADLILQQTR